MFCNLYNAPGLVAPCAVIDLKDAIINVRDGFSGTSAVDEATPAALDVTIGLDAIVVNGPLGTDIIPVGARWTFATAQPTTIYTVATRTPSDGLTTTTDITFTPALSVVLPLDDEVMNWISQLLQVKIGEGNLTYTEAREYDYLLDRGNLDTVKAGDEVPMEVALEFSYQSATTGTSEAIAPSDAVKNIGSAVEWITSATDACEPYAVDLEIIHTPPCGTKQKETTTLPDFRFESLEYDLEAATIAVSGKSHAVAATNVRS